jgi:hypothetical protein
MRSNQFPFSYTYRSSKLLRYLFSQGWPRQALCFLLAVGMLIVPDAGYAISSASSLVVKVAKTTSMPFAFA